MCPDDYWDPTRYTYCKPPAQDFYEMQADFLVRAYVQAYEADLDGLLWFTLDGPGWRYSALLDGEDNPKPAYIAYKYMIDMVRYAQYIGLVAYGDGIVAYKFDKYGQEVHVLWTQTDQALSVTIPADKFISAWSRNGLEITPTDLGADKQVNVGFSPIYIVRFP
jgi:hypothetical protein